MRQDRIARHGGEQPARIALLDEDERAAVDAAIDAVDACVGTTAAGVYMNAIAAGMRRRFYSEGGMPAETQA